MASSEPWDPYLDEATPAPLSGNGWRLCGDGGLRASATLVDTLEELQQLEALLNATTPTIGKRLDPRLQRPWQRRNPLGSRFGGANSGSLFYGAVELETAIAEAAHRRLEFWQGMTTPPPTGRLRANHQAFSFAYHCPEGLRLQQRPFSRRYSALIDPDNYGATQALGADLCARGIIGFEYPSARCPHAGINLAFTSPAAFAATRVGDSQGWISEIDHHQVLFSDGQRLLRFSTSTLHRGIG